MIYVKREVCIAFMQRVVNLHKSMIPNETLKQTHWLVHVLLQFIIVNKSITITRIATLPVADQRDSLSSKSGS